MRRSVGFGGLAVGLLVLNVGCAANAESAAAPRENVEAQSADMRTPVVCPASATHYVMRLPDGDGAGTYSDGYSVPFPTPWILDTPNPPPTFLYEPDVATYEHDLTAVPSHEPFEFLVRNVYAAPCVDPVTGGQAACIREYTTKEWFLVGFTNRLDYAQAHTIAYSTPYYPGNGIFQLPYASFNVEPNVQAQLVTCVVVIDPPDPTTRVSQLSGYSFVFADEHDPGSNPYRPPSP